VNRNRNFKKAHRIQKTDPDCQPAAQRLWSGRAAGEGGADVVKVRLDTSDSYLGTQVEERTRWQTIDAA